MKFDNIDRRKNKYLFYIILISFFQNISSELTTCTKEAPILKDGTCGLEFCTEQQYATNFCEIANPIVKTQWINNFIIYAPVNYRCLSISSFSTGDMVIATTKAPKSSVRAFYGLKKNGRPYFQDKTTKKETPNYTKDTNLPNGQYQIESAIIKSNADNDKGTEYFFTFSKAEGYAEILDYKNDIIYSLELSTFTGFSVLTYRPAIISLESNNNEYSYMIAFLEGNNKRVYFQKYIFSSINNLQGKESATSFVTDGYGLEISCYKTTSEIIFCFFLVTGGNQFKIYKIEKNLNNQLISSYPSNINTDKLFTKCIHLKEDVGVFSIFYKYDNNKIKPFFIFKELKNNQLNNYLSNSDYEDSKIIIEKSDFNYTLAFTDLVKINDNKIAFVSCSTSKEILYIIVLNIFNKSAKNLVKIRYYSIQLWALYHIKILKDLRIHNYNDYLVCGISYCNIQKCETDDDEHYPGLMMFSYPSINDKSLNLEEYIYKDNNMDLLNLKWDLSKQLIIQNNIFGYILNSTYIIKIEGPTPYFTAYSSKDETVEIKENYTLENDEYMIFKYNGAENFFPTNK